MVESFIVRLRKRVGQRIRRETGAPLFFMHVGKCGGTAITSGLAEALGKPAVGYVNTPRWRASLEHFYDRDQPIPFQRHLTAAVAADAMQKMEQNCRIVTGHVPYIEDAFAPFHREYLFMTVLRDPSERVISSYSYGNAMRAKDVSQTYTIDAFLEWLESDVGKMNCCNLTYFFSGVPVCTEQSTYETALRSLERFDAVGFLDNLDAFGSVAGSMLGRVPRFSQKNTTSDKLPERLHQFPKKLRLDPRVTAVLKEKCRYDYGIYDRARELFGQSCGSGPALPVRPGRDWQHERP